MLRAGLLVVSALVGVSLVLCSAAPFPHGQKRDFLPDQLRLVLDQVRFGKEHGQQSCEIDATLIHNSDQEIELVLQWVQDQLGFGIRFWRVGTDDVYRLASNWPPGIPAPLI